MLKSRSVFGELQMMRHEVVVPPDESDKLSQHEFLALMFQMFANEMISEAENAARLRDLKQSPHKGERQPH